MKPMDSKTELIRVKGEGRYGCYQKQIVDIVTETVTDHIKSKKPIDAMKGGSKFCIC